jgi:signal transduction histidine kinase
MTAALGLFVVFVVWLNSRLNKEVKNRTVELEASNRQLEVANEQLKSQEKMQKEFINIAAHELRTPIQPILGMAEILEAELVDKKDDFQIIARNARRLGRLTEDILDVTRIESNSLHLHREKFDLKDVIEALIGDYREHRQLNGNVKFAYDAESVIINADKNRIIQVLSNLLDNSIKFTEKGEISVMAQLKDGHVIVQVSDTGKGIDQEIMPRLFSKFATKSDKGTGLGLFISKSIVEAHGGMIWAENNNNNNSNGGGKNGVTFTFSIPR